MTKQDLEFNPPTFGKNPSGLVPLRTRDVARMKLRFRNLLESEPESVRSLSEQLFRRIATKTWSVEWNLPRWLGSVYGLTDLEQQRLVTANVFGLGYVRLIDDRRDAEISGGDVRTSASLETLFLNAAEHELHQLLGDDPWFLEKYGAIMTEWGRMAHHDFAAGVLGMSPGQLDRLATIGAPLLVCCAATVALKNRLHALESLITPVRHYLVAAVLYDHAKDWRADLDAGRVNYFIQSMLDSWNDSADPYVTRLGMYQAIIDGEKPRAYMDLVGRELALGIESANRTDLQPFASHLGGLALEVRASRDQMQEKVRHHLTQGMELFFPA